eukprot:PhM_4_TR7632/c0_g1_i1/m.12364
MGSVPSLPQAATTTAITKRSITITITAKAEQHQRDQQTDTFSSASLLLSTTPHHDVVLAAQQPPQLDYSHDKVVTIVEGVLEMHRESKSRAATRLAGLLQQEKQLQGAPNVDGVLPGVLPPIQKQRRLPCGDFFKATDVLDITTRSK